MIPPFPSRNDLANDRIGAETTAGPIPSARGNQSERALHASDR